MDLLGVFYKDIIVSIALILGGKIGSCRILPECLLTCLALALFFSGSFALVGCPGNSITKGDAGTDSSPNVDSKPTPSPAPEETPGISESNNEADGTGQPSNNFNPKPALPPGFEGIFMVPDANKDQHGNAVVSRNGSRTDPATGWLYEVWLKEPRLELVLIPAGEFDMGSTDTEANHLSSEDPVHRVRFSKPFYMGKYEVTQGQWEVVMGSNPSEFKVAGKDAPVEKVSWDDCREFIDKLNAPIVAVREPPLRLPTEAEREYACRAGTTTPFHFGSTITSEQVNHNGKFPYGNTPIGLFRVTTTKVGSFPANAWGLYDMHGNVWEWCEDVWHDNYKGAPGDGSAWLQGGIRSDRVLRGGSWCDFAGSCRSARRGRTSPSARHYCYGFRLALSTRIQ